MSEINDENTLNEFEYTEEEKAELAKLDALNENSDELKTHLMNYRDWETDRKSTRLNSSHSAKSRMPSSA